MKRRTGLKLATAFAALAAMGATAATAETVKIGAVGPKTGGLAGGAAVTQWPTIQLWVSQVNAAGGLNVGGTMMPIELIEYDDQTNPGETIRAVQRLATQDEVDFIISPYGTGFVVAAAPIFARYGYPLIAVSAITDQQPELSAQFGDMFFTLGTTTAFVQDLVKILTDMRDAGQLGNRVAMVNVADAFGIELAAVGGPGLRDAGFEIVYETSYPLGTQDLSPVMKAAKAANPDAFVAWSYPPDTFALTEQAIIENLDVDAFYTAVATPFPSFGARFGAAANGILGPGGVNVDDPRFQAYAQAHQELTGQLPDYWASATTYASLEILQQSIEAVGLDRAAVTEHIRTSTFDSVLGPITFGAHNNNDAFWTVGQWQDGQFKGVASRGRDGAVPVIIKDGWE